MTCGDGEVMNKQPGTMRALFLTFLKIGAFTFGGGYAMIPLIQKRGGGETEVDDGRGHSGYHRHCRVHARPHRHQRGHLYGLQNRRFLGAVCCTTGVVLPSFLMIAAISLVLQAFERNRVVQYAFAGIRAGVLALICKALVSMYRQCPRNLFSYLLAGAAFLATAVFRVNVLLVILGCAACGLVHSAIVGRKQV